MSIRRILLLGFAATVLAVPAWANDDTYQCGESRCYDDQADETRRLNLMQLENPGAGLDAVPAQNEADAYGDPTDDDNDGDMNGQGGPYDPYNPEDDGDNYGPPPDAHSPPPDDSYGPDDAAPDADSYPDDDGDDDYPDDGAYPDDQ